MPRGCSFSRLNFDGYSLSSTLETSKGSRVHWTSTTTVRHSLNFQGNTFLDTLFKVRIGAMTASLLSSFVRLGLLILAPWLVFSKNDKGLEGGSFGEKQIHSHKKRKSQTNDIPVHFISLGPEDLKEREDVNLKRQLTEYCSIVSDVLSVCWLTLTISIRNICTKLSLSLNAKQSMESEEPATNLEFSTDEIKVMGSYVASPAVESLLHHPLPASSRVKQTVPDHFLLQFAALTDDLAAQKCIEELGEIYKPTEKHGLLGVAEKSGWDDQPWERRVNRHKHGVAFTMERKYLRNGLYVYRSTAMFKYARVEDFRHFILNSAVRTEWDFSTVSLKLLQTETEVAEVPVESESGFIFTENRMPRPLCNREYVSARRIWARQDGGCYSVAKSAPHPMAPPRRGRNVRVEEYTSAFVVRPLHSVNGERMDAVEMTSLYFDNAKMRPMAYNLAMNASMWAGIVTVDTGFRKHQAATYPVRLSEDQVLPVASYDPMQEQQLLERSGSLKKCAPVAFAVVALSLGLLKLLGPRPEGATVRKS